MTEWGKKACLSMMEMPHTDNLSPRPEACLLAVGWAQSLNSQVGGVGQNKLAKDQIGAAKVSVFCRFFLLKKLQALGSGRVCCRNFPNIETTRRGHFFRRRVDFLQL